MTVAEELARLSAEEMSASIGIGSGAPTAIRKLVAAPFELMSRRLGETLASFDEETAAHGIDVAAKSALEAFGATLSVRGSLPRGPVLVAANHPGAFDSLALMAACGRKDLLFLADDRDFLRAMTHVAEHLAFVDLLDRSRSARALRRAVLHLREGGAVVQFGAGRIEADPSFAAPGVPRVGSWRSGTGILARSATRFGGAVVPAIVSGVHSARAKHSLVNRAAEARGVTTLALLLQVAIPGFRRVDIEVAFDAPMGPLAHLSAAHATKLIEQRARALAGSRPRSV